MINPANITTNVCRVNGTGTQGMGIGGTTAKAHNKAVNKAESTSVRFDINLFR
jgi:hypothetical protein